jgi:hypothetical protein
MPALQFDELRLEFGHLLARRRWTPGRRVAKRQTDCGNGRPSLGSGGAAAIGEGRREKTVAGRPSIAMLRLLGSALRIPARPRGVNLAWLSLSFTLIMSLFRIDMSRDRQQDNLIVFASRTSTALGGWPGDRRVGLYVDWRRVRSTRSTSQDSLRPGAPIKPRSDLALRTSHVSPQVIAGSSWRHRHAPVLT